MKTILILAFLFACVAVNYADDDHDQLEDQVWAIQIKSPKISNKNPFDKSFPT